MFNNNFSGIQTAHHQQIYGPQRVIDLNSIQKQLGCFNLSSSQILIMAKDAMLHGHIVSNNAYICGQYCHQIVHQNLIFVLSQAYDAVISIHWASQCYPNNHSSNPITACSHTNDKFAVQQCMKSSDDLSFEPELIDEIVTDLFDDTTFIAENSNVLLSKLSDVHAVSSFYSNSTVSDGEDMCMDEVEGEEEGESMETSTSTSNDEVQCKRDYHTIYMKRIMERLEKQTHSKTFSAETIIKIVDNAIKRGSKKKISKRTFEFKWGIYTVIMSKSLKTILDFTIDDDDDIAITVHPDVVSIITKKHKFLDYFRIQSLAKEAKLNGSFSTKKKDYRQQFVYEYSGFRVVFASNHSTIVEMQMIKE